MGKLNLDINLINRGRQAARKIAEDTQVFIDIHSTIAVERTVARLYGIDGVDDAGVPLPNIVIENIKNGGGIKRGIAFYLANAALNSGKTMIEIAEGVTRGEIDLLRFPLKPYEAVKQKAVEMAVPMVERIRNNRGTREGYLKSLGEGAQPYLYVIVATGNIYEDVLQAQSAAKQGADIIAVIRTTGQSLLDYVPYGATTEGFGGTYATQENFRIMRKAVDEVGREIGRYIRLCNYSSGLCMPEIAAMGAMERLDVMLNDALY
jgi:beta-lysine 5,6-aminomutase alpha subunit